MQLINKGGILASAFLMSVVFSNCSQKQASSDEKEKAPVKEAAVKPVENNTLSGEEKSEGWLLMFDGKSSNGWRGFKKDYFPANWEVVDGTLHMKSKMTEEEKKDRADIVYNKEFENFIFRMEWKIAEGGNSGIFYLGKETDEFSRIYHTAPEMQVLDNDKHPDAKKGKDGNRKAGSLYDLIPAKPQNAKPVGQWNKVEITVNNGKVIHKQNGKEVVSYDFKSPEWAELVAGSKFPGLNPNWANLASKGLIGLQDHGDDVWFRNLRIKEL